MIEHFFQCPYCWETISVLIDPSQNHQNYIEDCEVCCNPMRFNIEIEDNSIIAFEVLNIEQ